MSCRVYFSLRLTRFEMCINRQFSRLSCDSNLAHLDRRRGHWERPYRPHGTLVREARSTISALPSSECKRRCTRLRARRWSGSSLWKGNCCGRWENANQTLEALFKATVRHNEKGMPIGAAEGLLSLEDRCKIFWGSEINKKNTDIESTIEVPLFSPR